MKKNRIRVKLRSFDAKLIDKSVQSIVSVVKEKGVEISGPIPLPVEVNKFTVLRSPHVYKESREQFEMRTYKRLIDILNPNSYVIDALMGLELPPGIDVEIK